MSDHDADNDMTTVDEYRDVGLHDFQLRERIKAVVKPAIDAVFAIGDGPALLAYARNAQHPPEARLPTTARIEAIWQFAAENREGRPKVHPERARVTTDAPDSLHWANPRSYGTLLEPGPAPGERRPERDTASQAALKGAQEAWRVRDGGNGGWPACERRLRQASELEAGFPRIAPRRLSRALSRRTVGATKQSAKSRRKVELVELPSSNGL